MNREIIINVQRDYVRAAILEDERLAEILIEDGKRRGVVGNIYQGIVKNVLPGMKAAFVDIGLERNAFLYLKDLDLDKEISNELVKTSLEEELVSRRVDFLRPGEQILVQAVKEAMGGKGVRVNSNITLPGRYLVLIPSSRYIGVSRRITSDEQRKRLEEIVKELAPPNMGLIARTNAEGREINLFKNELELLLNKWNRIKRRSKRARVGTLIYEELPLTLRIVRDIFAEAGDRITVDSPLCYQKIIEFLDELGIGHLKQRVNLYEDDEPIFEALGIEPEITKAISKKVWLKCGGYIIIDELEALVAIDVNSGRYTGSKDLEETILRVNLEAAEEVANQIRLRNLGGIIIVDFIDMESETNQRKLLEVLEKELLRDRVKCNVFSLTELGLVEITRKKSSPSLSEILCQNCPTCQGNGRIPSLRSLEQRLISKIKSKIKGVNNKRDLHIRLNPGVYKGLKDSEEFKELEEELDLRIEFSADEDFNWEEIEILHRLS